MKRVALRFGERLGSARVGLAAFASLALLTAAMIGFSEMPVPHAPMPLHTPVQATGPGGIKLSGQLSQTKLLQGSNGALYLNLEVEAPSSTEGVAVRAATDMIVILDQSGSMAAENRLPFAKQAIVDLLNRLTEEDRFALVTFDSSATLVSELTPVTLAERERLIRVVNTVQPGSGTNMSGGLFKARELALRNRSERSRKMLLLSDGQANEGITHPGELNQIARSINESGLILSTIGMGLGFNETLMASLADHGMGSYAYLEHLGGLGEILARNLTDSRKVYARSSELELTLSPGVTLVDAGGYPLSPVSPTVVRVPIGQILSGAKRSLTLSFNVPTKSLGEFTVGTVELRYQLAAGAASVHLGGDRLMLAVLPLERRGDALASVNEPVIKSSWLSNNLGRLKAAYRDAIASGDRDKARAALSGYYNEARKTESSLGVSIVDEATRSELKSMERDLNDAFAGPAPAQAVKQQRLAKKAHAEGLAAQRK